MKLYLYVRHPMDNETGESLHEEFEIPFEEFSDEVEKIVGKGTLFSIDADHDGITDVLSTLTENELATFDQLSELLEVLWTARDNKSHMAGLKYALAEHGMEHVLEDSTSWESRVVSGPHRGTEEQARLKFAEGLFFEVYDVPEELARYIDIKVFANDLWIYGEYTTGEYDSIEYLNEQYIIRMID